LERRFVADDICEARCPTWDSRQLQSQSSDHMGAVGRRQDGVRPVQGAFEAAWSNASNAGAQKSPAAVP
jgi:hypothetical protein